MYEEMHGGLMSEIRTWNREHATAAALPTGLFLKIWDKKALQFLKRRFLSKSSNFLHIKVRTGYYSAMCPGVPD